MTPLRLDNRAAIVTGAGRGLGRAAAIALAQMGAGVVVNDLGVSRDGQGDQPHVAETVAAEIRSAGGRAVASFETVADYESAGRIIETAVSAYGGVDILVNNAAITSGSPVWETPPEQFRAVVDVCLFGAFNCTRHAAPIMKDRGWGRIVNVLSRSGLWGTAGGGPYGSGKGGMFGLNNVICRDLAPFGITANAVVPGAMMTRMITESAERMRDEGLDPDVADRFISDAQNPADVAAVIAYLCSEEAAAVNGQVLFVKGGQVGWFAPLEVAKQAHSPGGWAVGGLAAAIPKLDIPPLPPAYGG